MEDTGLGVLVVVLDAAGVSIIWVGRKQATGTLPRNWFAGVRTPETMRSGEAWRAAHAATAGLVTAAGVVQGATGSTLPHGPSCCATICAGAAMSTSTSYGDGVVAMAACT
jgi:hypothetical protein